MHDMTQYVSGGQRATSGASPRVTKLPEETQHTSAVPNEGAYSRPKYKYY